jgi:hypothetical protein
VCGVPGHRDVHMTATLFTGMLLLLERCHGFDCKVIKRYHQGCTVSTEFTGRFGEQVGQASMLGRTFPSMHWFQEGRGGNGFHGQVGMQTLTVFLRSHDWSAYLSEYSNRQDYDKWTCKGIRK